MPDTGPEIHLAPPRWKQSSIAHVASTTLLLFLYHAMQVSHGRRATFLISILWAESELGVNLSKLSGLFRADMSDKKYKINEETLKQTTKCIHNFACLKQTLLPDKKLPPRCFSIRTSERRIVRTMCAMKTACPYCEPLGLGEGICTCPVRNELYRRYGI